VSSYIDFVKSMGKLNNTCKGPRPWANPGANEIVPVPRTKGSLSCPLTVMPLLKDNNVNVAILLNAETNPQYGYG
jgi:hypothetical protein